MRKKQIPFRTQTACIMNLEPPLFALGVTTFVFAFTTVAYAFLKTTIMQFGPQGLMPLLYQHP